MPRNVSIENYGRVFRKGSDVVWWIASSTPQNAVVLRADRARSMTFIRTEFEREHWAYNEDLSYPGE